MESKRLIFCWHEAGIYITRECELSSHKKSHGGSWHVRWTLWFHPLLQCTICNVYCGISYVLCQMTIRHKLSNCHFNVIYVTNKHYILYIVIIGETTKFTSHMSWTTAAFLCEENSHSLVIYLPHVSKTSVSDPIPGPLHIVHCSGWKSQSFYLTCVMSDVVWEKPHFCSDIWYWNWLKACFYSRSLPCLYWYNVCYCLRSYQPGSVLNTNLNTTCKSTHTRPTLVTQHAKCRLVEKSLWPTMQCSVLTDAGIVLVIF